jgi:uncharacterized protein
VRFWDSSALVPLIVEEPTSKACRQLLRTDKTQLVWCVSRTEVLSALWRRRRDARLTDDEIRKAEARLELLGARWAEVDAVPVVREVAERLLRVHPLRSADALQLGAALVALGPRTRGRQFVALDDALLGAAEREGFDALRPS